MNAGDPTSLTRAGQRVLGSNAGARPNKQPIRMCICLDNLPPWGKKGVGAQGACASADHTWTPRFCAKKKANVSPFRLTSVYVDSSR